ncbi:MAG: peptidase [Actinotalea sp.]|nr:peptidase [Actinotalea sp.]
MGTVSHQETPPPHLFAPPSGRAPQGPESDGQGEAQGAGTGDGTDAGRAAQTSVEGPRPERPSAPGSAEAAPPSGGPEQREELGAHLFGAPTVRPYQPDPHQPATPEPSQHQRAPHQPEHEQALHRPPGTQLPAGYPPHGSPPARYGPGLQHRAPPAAGAPGPGAYPFAPGHPDTTTAGPVRLDPALDSWGRPVREPRPRRSLSLAWLAPLLVLALLAGAGGGIAADRLLEPQRPSDAGLAQPAGNIDVGELEGVAAIAAGVLPSVVSVEVNGADGQGNGSGFILREDGYILTNNHVVAGTADGQGEIVVVFADGSEEPAEIVGRTSEYDLAVIKVQRSGLPELVLGDSDAVVVGDPVVAVGAPLGLQGTVTTGIVSALNRPVSAGNGEAPAFINAIQTDAAINPGNSGGPLVNVAGEVIGINSAIAQRPGSTTAAGSIGLGFAIPSNQVRRTASELIETGQATYPVIGVLLDQSYTGEGVQVATEASEGRPPVTPDGPADRAGIAPGDVIVAIDGRPLTQADELIVSLRAKAPGDAVSLTVRTGEDEREVRVVLDEFVSAP